MEASHRATAFPGWLVAGLAVLAFATSSVAGPLTSYTYDSLGRVTSVTYPTGVTVTYSYDALGNRINHGACALIWLDFTWGPTGPNWCSGSNNLPIPAPASASVGFDSSANPISVVLTGASASSLAISTQAAHGTATTSGLALSYTPSTSFEGYDSFQYTASNSAGTSTPATVTVVVAVGLPTANNVSEHVGFNSSNNPITLALGGGAETSVNVSTAATEGSATASGTVITYTPNSGYSGSDSFGYTASNTAGTSAEATASILVLPQAPIAGASTTTLVQNTSNNPLTLGLSGGTASAVSTTTAPIHGTATVSGVTILYTPVANYTGGDSLKYTASNSGGTSPPALATINIKSSFTPPSPPHAYTPSSPGTGTETVPDGAMFVTIAVDGGGGGGGCTGTDSPGSGGGGSGHAQIFVPVTGGLTFTYTLGSGGAHYPGCPRPGSTGGDSTVTGTASNGPVSLTGGGGGGGDVVANTGGSGGTVSGGDTHDNNGQAGTPGSLGGAGGAAGGGAGAETAPGGGGNGQGLVQTVGQDGQVSFTYQ